MRNLFTFFLLLITSLLYGQIMPLCEDPNPITIETDCGTQIDLCVDRYTMHGDDRSLELNIFDNDLGLIDPCACYICGPCSHGVLTRMANCNFVYTPEPSFVGCDTFYYALVVYDTCIIEDYCGPSDGKIWSIQSQYKGPDNRNLKVFAKETGSWNHFATVDNLMNGEIFWIDGSNLHTSQANWEYRFYSSSTSAHPEEVITVHTSCSQDVLGKDFGYFRTLAGCVAPQSDKSNCQITSATRNDIATRGAYMVTTRFEDETMVIIEILNVLPIELVDFSVVSLEWGNRISWEIANSSKDEYLIIEKSYDGVAFYGIASYDPMTAGKHEFVDVEVNDVLETYYRLAFHSYDGGVRYSDLKLLTSSSDRGGIQIYPNPANSALHVVSTERSAEIEFYEIIDLNGKLVYTEKSNIGNYSALPIENEFLEGIYIVNVTLSNGKKISKRILFVNM